MVVAVGASVTDIDIDDPPITRDGKAGWSSYCRRELHKSCAEHGAFCTCACHGARGQQPPSSTDVTPVTPIRKEVPMGEPTTNLICTEPDCDRSFASKQARSMHITKTHRKIQPRPPKVEAPKVADSTHLLIVRHGDALVPLELQTRVDAERVLELLATVGVSADRYEKAGG